MKFTEEHKKHISESRQKFFREQPELAYAICSFAGQSTTFKQKSMAGKIAHLKHPDLATRMNRLAKLKYPDFYKRGGIAMQSKYPGKSRQTIINTHKKWKEQDPEGYHQQHIRAGFGAVRANKNNKPYIWQNVHFMSRDELKVAMLLLDKPIEETNCHIKAGSKTIDFFPQSNDILFRGCLVEYHPYDRNKTPEEYYIERLEAINNSHLKGTPLILIISMENEKEGYCGSDIGQSSGIWKEDAGNILV